VRRAATSGLACLYLVADFAALVDDHSLMSRSDDELNQWHAPRQEFVPPRPRLIHHYCVMPIRFGATIRVLH